MFFFFFSELQMSSSCLIKILTKGYVLISRVSRFVRVCVEIAHLFGKCIGRLMRLKYKINWRREQTRVRNHFREAFSRRDIGRIDTVKMPLLV